MCDGLDSEGFDADSGGGSDGGGVLSPDDGGRRLFSTPRTIQDSAERSRREAERIRRTPPALLNDSARPKVAGAHNCFMIVGLRGVFDTAAAAAGVRFLGVAQLIIDSLGESNIVKSQKPERCTRPSTLPRKNCFGLGLTPDV